LLVPDDIVRDLPIAADWSDISRVVSENEDLRDRVNKSVGGIWSTMTKQEKAKLKTAALQNKESFESVLDVIRESSGTPYDIKFDPNAEVFWGKLLKIASEFPIVLKEYEHKSLNINEVYELVEKIINQFKFLIEHRGIWKELWNEDCTLRRNEKAAQRLFFSVADSYCKANDIDITPEADTGNGPVDFKVSSGYEGRVLVEIKMSDHTVVHGYKKQLEIYKEAERTIKAFFIIIDIGSLGNKYDDILKFKNEQVSLGNIVSEIKVIDGMPKVSASKRA
jgi:hypothetical protein